MAAPLSGHHVRVATCGHYCHAGGDAGTCIALSAKNTPLFGRIPRRLGREREGAYHAGALSRDGIYHYRTVM